MLLIRNSLFSSSLVFGLHPVVLGLLLALHSDADPGRLGGLCGILGIQSGTFPSWPLAKQVPYYCALSRRLICNSKAFLIFFSFSLLCVEPVCRAYEASALMVNHAPFPNISLELILWREPTQVLGLPELHSGAQEATCWEQKMGLRGIGYCTLVFLSSLYIANLLSRL